MALTMTILFATIRVLDAITAPFYRLVAIFSNHRPIPPVTNAILVTSASVLAEKIRARELTCKQVVAAFVQRCKEVDAILNAIVQERYVEALADAERADQFLSSTRAYVSQSQLKNEKPLLGIPITIKESCCVKGMRLSLGVERCKNVKAARNGDAVQLLLEAGAIPIAVTSTPPYSSWIETFNDIVGYTKNPYDTAKSSGGSTGGEAALIASAASVLGLGSDAGGSIRIPAAFCGIYGHKASDGRMAPTKGHANFFTHQRLLDMLAVGPLCRYAVDLQLAMDVLSGGETRRQRQRSIDTSTSTSTSTATQIRVYYLHEYEGGLFSVDATLKRKISQAITYLETEHRCPTQQINGADLRHIPELTVRHFQKLVTLASSDGDNYGAKYGVLGSGNGNGSDTVKKIIKILQSERLKGIWKMDDELYAKQFSNMRTKLSDLLEGEAVLLMPTWSESACYKYQAVWKAYNVCYDYFANAFGFASTAVPVGLDRNDMPLSIQILAARHRDDLCLRIAEKLEILFGGWIPPYDVPLPATQS